MTSLKDLPLADLESEIAATRRVIERLPDDKLGWSPHEKSRPLGELAAHLVDIMSWIPVILEEDGLDFAAAPPPSTKGSSRQNLLNALDSHATAGREALARTDDANLTRDWTLRFGDHVIFTRPKLVTLRSFCLSHAGHHRGQVTVYLRLLGVPLPPVYGPTADEQ